MKELAAAFFQRLDSLGNGERAAMRRSAGIPLHHASGRALSVFYRCLPYGVPERQEERWFAVACLRCLWDQREGCVLPLEQVIAQVLSSSDSTKNTHHRVELLLDMRWDSDGYMLAKLSRLIKLIRQKTEQASIDFTALLEDLIYWNAESQFVQRKWARAIFTNISKTERGEDHAL